MIVGWHSLSIIQHNQQWIILIGHTVGELSHFLTEFSSDLLFEKLHLLGFSMNQEYILGFAHPDQLHDALSIGVGAVCQKNGRDYQK